MSQLQCSSAQARSLVEAARGNNCRREALSDPARARIVARGALATKSKSRAVLRYMSHRDDAATTIELMRLYQSQATTTTYVSAQNEYE
jgi:hypothetical protein